MNYICRNKPKQWDIVLLQVEYAYNISVHTTAGRFSFVIVYTDVPYHITDLVKLPKGNSKSVALEHRVEEVLVVHDEVKQNLEKINAKYKASANLHRLNKQF